MRLSSTAQADRTLALAHGLDVSKFGRHWHVVWKGRIDAQAHQTRGEAWATGARMVTAARKRISARENKPDNAVR